MALDIAGILAEIARGTVDPAAGPWKIAPRMKSFILGIFAVTSLAVAPSAQADDRLTREWLRGFGIVLAPGLMCSTESQGASLLIDGRISYGFDLGAVVVAPSAVIPFFLQGEGFGGASVGVMGGVQASFPLGFAAPYALVGGGAAITTAPSASGGAFRGGGGISFFTEHFMFGAEVAYNSFMSANYVEILIPLSLRF